MRLSKIFNVRHPTIIQAPMAGGITTPELVSKVSNLQGIGSYATGYLNPNQVRQDIQSIKQLTNNPFAVNVFVPQNVNVDINAIQTYQKFLNKYRQEVKLEEATEIPELPSDNFEETMEIILKEKVKIVSFVFGVLPQEYIDKLKRENVYLIGTATNLPEAELLERAGVDAIVAQGAEAGGHRGGFIDCSMLRRDELILLQSEHIKIPIIAAGGIMNAEHILSALKLGASAVQMGTAFLPLAESGASSTYKSALLEAQLLKQSEPTTVTCHYSGKPARGLWTRFIREAVRANIVVPDYPIQHYMTQAIRKEATRLGNKELMSMWCGEGIASLNPAMIDVEHLLDNLWKGTKK